MAAVVDLRPHAREDFTSSLGMVIFLASWAMMFSALFFAYAYVRSSAPVWPPVGSPTLPVALPALNTAVMLASSVAFTRGIAGMRRGRRAELTGWVAATFVLGSVFLAVQLLVWRDVGAAGLTLSSSMYGSVFYALTFFHAAHVAVGLLVLALVIFRSMTGRYTEHNFVNVRLCAMFWHFVDVVWLLMFVSIYLI